MTNVAIQIGISNKKMIARIKSFFSDEYELVIQKKINIACN